MHIECGEENGIITKKTKTTTRCQSDSRPRNLRRHLIPSNSVRTSCKEVILLRGLSFSSSQDCGRGTSQQVESSRSTFSDQWILIDTKNETRLLALVDVVRRMPKHKGLIFARLVLGVIDKEWSLGSKRSGYELRFDQSRTDRPSLISWTVECRSTSWAPSRHWFSWYSSRKHLRYNLDLYQTLYHVA